MANVDAQSKISEDMDRINFEVEVVKVSEIPLRRKMMASDRRSLLSYDILNEIPD